MLSRLPIQKSHALETRNDERRNKSDGGFFFDAKTGNRKYFLFGDCFRCKIGGRVEYFCVDAEYEFVFAKKELFLSSVGHMAKIDGLPALSMTERIGCNDNVSGLS